jgi:hypothetical protein
MKRNDTQRVVVLLWQRFQFYCIVDSDMRTWNENRGNEILLSMAGGIARFLLPGVE